MVRYLGAEAHEALNILKLRHEAQQDLANYEGKIRKRISDLQRELYLKQTRKMMHEQSIKEARYGQSSHIEHSRQTVSQLIQDIERIESEIAELEVGIES